MPGFEMERRLVEMVLRETKQMLKDVEGLSFCREIFPDEVGDPELEEKMVENAIRLFTCEGLEDYVIVFDGYAFTSGLVSPFIFVVPRSKMFTALRRFTPWRERARRPV